MTKLRNLNPVFIGLDETYLLLYNDASFNAIGSDLVATKVPQNNYFPKCVHITGTTSCFCVHVCLLTIYKNLNSLVYCFQFFM